MLKSCIYADSYQVNYVSQTLFYLIFKKVTTLGKSYSTTPFENFCCVKINDDHFLERKITDTINNEYYLSKPHKGIADHRTPKTAPQNFV